MIKDKQNDGDELKQLNNPIKQINFNNKIYTKPYLMKTLKNQKKFRCATNKQNFDRQQIHINKLNNSSKNFTEENDNCQNFLITDWNSQNIIYDHKSNRMENIYSNIRKLNSKNIYSNLNQTNLSINKILLQSKKRSFEERDVDNDTKMYILKKEVEYLESDNEYQNCDYQNKTKSKFPKKQQILLSKGSIIHCIEDNFTNNRQQKFNKTYQKKKSKKQTYNQKSNSRKRSIQLNSSLKNCDKMISFVFSDQKRQTNIRPLSSNMHTQISQKKGQVLENNKTKVIQGTLKKYLITTRNKSVKMNRFQPSQLPFTTKYHQTMKSNKNKINNCFETILKLRYPQLF